MAKIRIKELHKRYPRDEEIWRVEIPDMAVELNSYYLTHKEAIDMCYASFDDKESTAFTVSVYEDFRRKKNKKKMIRKVRK